MRAEAEKRDSIRQAEMAQQLAEKAEIESDSVDAQKRAKYGLLAEVVEGDEEFFTLENENLRIIISSRGGRVYSAELKNYKAYGDKPVKLLDGDKNEFGFQFTHNNRFFYSNELYFSKLEGDNQSLKLALPIGDGKIIYHYNLKENDYVLDFKIESEDVGDKIYTQGAAVDFTWITDMPCQEKSHKSEGLWSGLYYKYFGGDVEELGASGDKSENVNMSVSWIALKDQYFSTIFQSEKGFAGASIESKAKEVNDTILKHADVRVGVKFDFHYNTDESFRFLFVPNYFYILDSFEDMDLVSLLPLGWGIFGWINRYFIIPLFKYLESAFVNYGLVILILTIIIKLILFPFSISSFKSQAKMRVLRPQIEAINEKIPEDKPMERQQATMKLYKSAGVSPLGGCLPMLLQMPILFAAFRFFPAAVELRGQSFLWAEDLSTYDSILDLPFSIPFYGDHVSLFCLLMCIVNVLFSRYNMQSQANAQMQQMKWMMYLMPVMLLFFFNDYPAGLCYYYFISTTFTVIQTLLIKVFLIDDEAILAQLEANKKRPQNAKKSRWQQRYEELMKEQMRKQQKK